MAGGGDESHGKRKREEGSERKAKAARFSKARQERLEQEFAETYGGLTALYKLLEIKQLQSPLLLPRALSYRLPRATKGVEKKLKKPAKATARRDPPVSGAVMRDVKLGLTSDLLETLKNENHRLGLRLAIYSADGSEFADNLFTLVAECTIPVPWFKEVRIPAKVLPQHADIVVVALQVVEIGDLAEKLAQETAFMFAPPAKMATVETTAGKTLLTASTNGRAPLYGNLLRIKVAQRRTGQFEVDLPSISSSMGGGVKCQFRLEWDPLPKAAKMQRLAAVCKAKFAMESADPLNQEGFKLAIPKRDIRSLGDGQNCSGVWFHFLYHSMLRRMSEKRPDYSCAWCNMYAGSLRGLVAHLVSSHDRFRFQTTVGHDNIPHIYVMVVGTRPPTLGGDGAVRSALCELEMSRDDELDRFEHHFSYKSTTKYGNGRGKRSSSVPGADAVDAIMQEFDELDELSQDQPQEFYAPLLQRQYFHSRTGAVVLDHEKDYDSDDDVDEEWIIQQSEKLLDEFEDVALEEKEFMKKWNRHVREYKILADFMVASSCRLFAKRHGKWLLDHGLRHNFLLHLLNLWDNSLLNSRAIIDCMLIVDHLAVVEKATNTDDSAGKPSAASTAAE